MRKLYKRKIENAKPKTCKFCKHSGTSVMGYTWCMNPSLVNYKGTPLIGGF